MINRFARATFLIMVMLGVTACPIQPEMGDWLLAVNEDGLMQWGLSLKPDGTVVSFDYGGTEALDGVITWVSDGVNLTIERTSPTEHHVYDGVLQSPTYAEGDFSILAGVVIGTCYLTKKPVTLTTG